MKRFALLVALFVIAVPAYADFESGELSGTYGFYGDDCEASSNAPDCKMTFRISGQAAKRLYQRLKAKEVADECTGGKSKDDGNGVRCLKEDDGYTCDFGYSFKQRKMTDSNVTC
jgi:hypothetical protein